jgi:tryptophan synthase alpha chain
VPFSDPLADGPVIQRSSERALSRGVTLARVLDVVREIRRKSQLPLVLFSYLNPLLQRGFERVAAEAAKAGVDGVLVTDLPPEEGEAWIAAARAAELDTIFLASPTSPDDRLRRVARRAAASCTPISRTGVTGERQALSGRRAAAGGASCARSPRVPVALGFGILDAGAGEGGGRGRGRRRGRKRFGALPGEHPQGDLGARVKWLTSTT